MRHQWFRRARPKGFVLLQTLWMLILASLLILVAMTTSLNASKNGAAAVATFQAELAAESAVHRAMYELIAHGPQNSWSKNGQSMTMAIDGVEVSVSVINANGLVDVNAADEVTLRRTIAAALSPADTVTLIDAIRGAKPILDYATLQSVEGMSSEKFESLFPCITLYSRHALPLFANAPDRLVKALHLTVAGRSVLSDTGAVIGDIFRIEAIARTKAASSRKLAVELLITGRLDQPYWIYDWSWHPRDTGC